MQFLPTLVLLTRCPDKVACKLPLHAFRLRLLLSANSQDIIDTPLSEFVADIDHLTSILPLSLSITNAHEPENAIIQHISVPMLAEFLNRLTRPRHDVCAALEKLTLDQQNGDCFDVVPSSPLSKSHSSMSSTSSAGLSGSSGCTTVVSSPTWSHKSSRGMIAELLDEPLMSQTLSTFESQIKMLVNETTAVFQLALDKAQLAPMKPYVGLCRHASFDDCSSDCLNKVRFVPQILAHTERPLEDCSYLDKCYKSKSCRFLHYQVKLPEHFGNHTRHVKDDADEPRAHFYSMDPMMRVTLPPQWITCNLKDIALPVFGDFAAIIADPPWDIHMNSQKLIITDSDLQALNMGCLQREGVFLLWVTGRTSEVGRKCLAKWGYTDVQEIVWCKTNQLGRTICTGRTGHWLNHSKEHVLIGTKGKPEWLTRGLDVDTIVSNARDKSQKPEELYDIVERMVGKSSRKLELFGRENNLRPGWLTVGSQLNGVNIMEPDLAERYERWRVAHQVSVPGDQREGHSVRERDQREVGKNKDSPVRNNKSRNVGRRRRT